MFVGWNRWRSQVKKNILINNRNGIIADISGEWKGKYRNLRLTTVEVFYFFILSLCILNIHGERNRLKKVSLNLTVKRLIRTECRVERLFKMATKMINESFNNYLIQNRKFIFCTLVNLAFGSLILMKST